jgi:hypothetical protein
MVTPPPHLAPAGLAEDRGETDQGKFVALQIWVWSVSNIRIHIEYT